jgi:hypothetical protein
MRSYTYEGRYLQGHERSSDRFHMITTSSSHKSLGRSAERNADFFLLQLARVATLVNREVPWGLRRGDRVINGTYSAAPSET